MKEVLVDRIQATDELRSAGDGSIVECFWERYPKEQITKDGPRGEWKFMRKREDKLLANADWVVQGILRGLESNIVESDLRIKDNKRK